MAVKNTTKTKPAASKEPAQAETVPFRERLRLLYLGKSRAAHNFRYGLLAFDIVTILFIVGTSFIPRTPAIEWLDLVFRRLACRRWSSKRSGADFGGRASRSSSES